MLTVLEIMLILSKENLRPLTKPLAGPCFRNAEKQRRGVAEVSGIVCKKSCATVAFKIWASGASALIPRASALKHLWDASELH